MTDRPILRLPNPENYTRRTGVPRARGRAEGPGHDRQGQRFQSTFDRLSEAFQDLLPDTALRVDPAGIAPERALVFVCAGPVQNFLRAARAADLDVFAEIALPPTEEFPDGFIPPGDATSLDRTLYATMPTIPALRQMLTLWNAHQNQEAPPRGAAPWWRMFDCLLELRSWGPQDRFTETARTIIESRLFDEAEETNIEIEFWPTPDEDSRARWRRETETAVGRSGGRIIDRSSISERDFVYDAMLVAFPTDLVRDLIRGESDDLAGLLSYDGIQFVLPQTLAMASPVSEGGGEPDTPLELGFDENAPVRAAVFDGVPLANHRLLDGGLYIEDIHDLSSRSLVQHRHHATAMCSLILRGHLPTDGGATTDARVVSVPILIDTESAAESPSERLLVDLIHVALTRLFHGEEPLAPNVFVVNLAIGVRDMRFAGRMSALARLLDWWSATTGVLFVISSGNINDGLEMSGVNSIELEDAERDEQHRLIRDALRAATYNRTLLSPSEAINGLAVGALSDDAGSAVPPERAGIIGLHPEGRASPQMTSALGPGLHRSIKPDILTSGGLQEARPAPAGDHTILRPIHAAARSGLQAAAPGPSLRAVQKIKGTSPAAALTTRAILQSAAAITGEDGPFEGIELSRREYALMTRALAVHSARWEAAARDEFSEALLRLGSNQHARAKEEVIRRYGHGPISPDLMCESPENGATLIGFGTIRKDHARLFKVPLPPSLSGERVPRSMRITLAWFSPVDPRRAPYRLAGLEAVSAENNEGEEDKRWVLDLSSDGPDANMVKRGTVWSRRLVHRREAVPSYDENAELPVYVQCRDTSGGGFSPDEDIEFAIAVTLEIEAEVEFDIHQEIRDRVRVRLEQ